MNKNAYFQLEHRSDGIYLLLYPGEEGSKLNLREIEDYLKKHQIQYQRDSLKNAVSTFRAFNRIKLSNQANLPIEQESLVIDIDSMHRQAIGTFYPPASTGKLLTKTEIVSELVRVGVKFGVVEQTIDEFLANRQYCHPYVLAEALLPVEGHSASITYHFNTDLTRQPKRNEDGSVDFHQLDTISHIKAGACLATLDPAVQGKPGIDVTGRVITPMKVQSLILRKEKNTRISEDGLQLFSLVDGHANLIGGNVFVSNLFEVQKDVGPSTGDINFEGNVRVYGNVLTGYSIHAGGDIVVDGVVEGAELIAGGQIVLKRGIQGMNRGRLVAEGNVVTKFIESAEVRAGGYVETDAIMHSYVYARGKVSADGKRGFITGGEIHSEVEISAKLAGSTMGTVTVLNVGNDPEQMDQLRDLEKELPKLEKQLEKENQILTMYVKKLKSGEKLDANKMLQLKMAKSSKDDLTKKIQESLELIEELKSDSGKAENGCVRIYDTIFPGCKIVLYNVVYFIRSDMKYCRFIKDHSEVKLVEF